MVEKQLKAIMFHYLNNARNYGFGQVFSYQIVSLAVTTSREVTK